MNARQHLQDIALTLGLPALDFDSNGCARMLFDGKVAVNFESDELSGQLHLYCDLGELPLRGREALYRALLEANLFGVQTQGATLAVDGSQFVEAADSTKAAMTMKPSPCSVKPPARPEPFRLTTRTPPKPSRRASTPLISIG